MTGFEPQYRDAKKIARGMKEGNTRCHCGKIKNRHTMDETRACKNSIEAEYWPSVEPEKRAKLDLTKTRK